MVSSEAQDAEATGDIEDRRRTLERGTIERSWRAEDRAG